MRAVGVIPARFQSSRFPGKALALIAGKTLVQRVFERARGARRLSRLVVATDDDRIRTEVERFGGEAVMTSPGHPSGTDRLAEVARAMEADIFVNIQGDEPLLDPGDVDRLVGCMEDDVSVDIGTLREPLADRRDADDPNIVKVVCDEHGRALYFSRSRIPHGAGPHEQAGDPATAPWFRHVGVYAYRGDFLLRFSSWAPTPLERAERLEQLRALERGAHIRVLDARGRYHGVDTPEDVKAVEAALRSGL